MLKQHKFDYIENISKFGIDLTLERIKKLMDLMGNPQDSLEFIHAAGTNGKGSTCSMIESVLIQAGCRTGKFVSPHLEQFNERISVNGEYITDSEIERLSELIKEKIKIMLDEDLEHPTQFEVICAMAFQYYFEQKCDVVVLEVGLGGRLDATNIIKRPLVCVITPISVDHVDRLGSTLEAIAFEKAGIIKPGCSVVCAPQEKPVSKLILYSCKDRGCELQTVDKDNIIFKGFKNGYQVFDCGRYANLNIKLLGQHQLINSAVAIKCIEILILNGLKIKNQDIYEGLKKAENKGRFEVIGQSPEIVIDGAHNLSGIKALKDTLEQYYKERRIILVMAVLSNKDYEKMVEVIAPLADICIVSEPISDSALSAEELAKQFNKHGKRAQVIKDIHQAVDTAISLAKDNGVVCFCGSLYFIGHVRTYLIS